MTQPVWTLSVDLQTKTAVFQSGLADAAKAARGSFNDIKTSANEMGAGVRYSMRESRESIMAVSEMFGIHLPASITRTVAGLETLGPALAAALPFAAIAVGAALFIEHLRKAREEADKLKDSQLNFGTVIDNVYTGLDNKLLEAGIRADELNNDHLSALNKQLTLIDHQSLTELVHAFDEMGKAADLTFAQLKTSWYQFGAGSEGAKHALTDFKAQYDSLLAQGKDKEASDLLAGTRQSAEKVLELQKQAIANQFQTGKSGQHTDYSKFEAASNELKKQGIGFTDKEVTAQQTLVDALRAQVEVEGKVQALKQAQSQNARTETDNKIGADDDKLYRAQADAQKKAINEQDKADDEAYRVAVERIQQAEQEKLAATRQGSQARLNAIDAAIQEENAHGLQETGMYKSLLQARIEVARQMADEQSKLQADAGKEAAEHTLRMGALQVAAEREHSQLRLGVELQTGRERLQNELSLANEEYQLQRTALEKQIQALDQHAADYLNKKKALENKEEELERQHQNKLQQIQDQGAQQQYGKLTAGQTRLAEIYTHGFTRVLMAQETFAKMMQQTGQQIVSGMLQNALMSAATMDIGKEKEAAAAARKFFVAGTHFPFPINLVMAPALGAMAFASVMAFEQGGLVPGVGVGDTVPAMLTPGEHVMSKQLTEHLTNMAKFGKSDGDGGHVHYHSHNSYTVHAIDGASVKGMLEKHKEEFSKHFHSQVRRMNKR
jgi:hypothetical protein